MRPFWRYYGGKFRAAPKYPKPLYDTIIEPFAGAAGYSLRYSERNIVLVEKYPVIAEMWRWLIAVTPAEVRRIPPVDCVHDLPPWVSAGARSLVGFCMNDANVSPCITMSSGLKKLRATNRKLAGWSETRVDLVASQVASIKHWRIIEGDYTDSPAGPATWFIDPPYANQAGSHYVHSDIDYEKLGVWCQQQAGQVMVCENEGATWLPFEPFATFKAGVNGQGSKEVLYTSPYDW